MRTLPLLLALLAGCSSSEFAVNESAADTGGSAADTGTASTDTAAPADDTGTTSTDTGEPTDSGTAPEVGPDASGGCTTLPSNPATVYVDKRSTKPAKGTADCPFTSIKDALALVNGLPSGSGAHQVRVAGGAVGAPLTYDEPMLVLKWQTKLTGDGIGRVVITGGGACGDGTCMVVMEGGSTLEGVTLDAKGLPKVPVAMGPGILTTALVKSTEIIGTKDDKSPAIYVDGGGAAEVGPDMYIHDNGGHAILVKTTAALKLTSVGGGPNKLHRNLVGVQMLGGRLDMSGTTEVFKNRVHGIVIINAEKGHVIDGLMATENAGTAVFVDGGASLKMRRSKLLANDTGLVFRFNATNELDLGTALLPGGNTFGTPTLTNKRMGICLPAARNLPAPAQKNTFSACPPTYAVIAEAADACGMVSGPYKDIYFASAAADPLPPLDLNGCEAK